jgi:hypothetical protein
MEEEDWKCHQRIEGGAYAYHLHSTAFPVHCECRKELERRYS